MQPRTDDFTPIMFLWCCVFMCMRVVCVCVCVALRIFTEFGRQIKYVCTIEQFLKGQQA